MCETFFFTNHAKNETARLVPDAYLYFEKTLYEVKASGQQLNLKMLGSPQLGQTIKTKCMNF